MASKVFWKRALGALFLFLFSCSSSANRWDYDEIRSTAPCYRVARIILRPKNPFRDLGVEIVESWRGVNVYLTAYSLSFPRDENHPDCTPFSLSIEGNCQTFLAERFMGGQKLLIPEEAQEILITGLLSGKCILISAGRFEANIPPEGFSPLFRRL